jgi:hypothetical protein
MRIFAPVAGEDSQAAALSHGFYGYKVLFGEEILRGRPDPGTWKLQAGAGSGQSGQVLHPSICLT